MKRYHVHMTLTAPVVEEYDAEATITVNAESDKQAEFRAKALVRQFLVADTTEIEEAE